MLLNAFSFNMLPAGFRGTITVEPADAQAARAALAHGSAVGHADMATILERELGCPVPLSRRTIALRDGDEAVVAQVRGERLPSGATELPPSARIEFFTVRIHSSRRM